MTTYFSGQILQGVKKLINQSDKRDFWLQVCKNLSAFYCKNNLLNSEDNEQEHPIFTVIDNQLSRGLPTLTSINQERLFAETFGLTEEANSNIGSITFDFNEDASEYSEILKSEKYVLLETEIKDLKQKLESGEKVKTKLDEKIREQKRLFKSARKKTSFKY